MVFVGVVDDVYVGALRQGSAVVGAVPSLVEAVGVEDLHPSAVEDCQAVVGEGFAGTAEARTEDGDACVVVRNAIIDLDPRLQPFRLPQRACLKPYQEVPQP